MLNSHSILIFISFYNPHLLPFSIPIHPRKHSNLSPLPSPSFPYHPSPRTTLIQRVAFLIYVSSPPSPSLIPLLTRLSATPTHILFAHPDFVITVSFCHCQHGLCSAPLPFCCLANYMQSPSPSPSLSHFLLPYLICLSIMGKKHSFVLCIG